MRPRAQLGRLSTASVVISAMLAVTLQSTGASAASASSAFPISQRTWMNSSGSASVPFTGLSPCPAPSPLQVDEGQPLPVNDPLAKHCYIDPVVAGEVGANGEAATSHALPQAYEGDGAPFAGPIAPAISNAPSNGVQPAYLGTYAAYQNGVLETQSNLTLQGIAFTLYAQKPTFHGPGSVSNWIGMQSCNTLGCGADFVQVGIDSNNVGNCGNGNGGGNTAPEVFFQVEINGNYETAQCLTNYVFGVGSQTFFWIGWDTSNHTWYAWIDWNNTWEEVNALGPETKLVPGHAYASNAPGEIDILGTKYTQPASVGTINDQQGQLYAEDGTTGVYFWEWWFNDIPTSATRQGPYCLFFPTEYTNNSLKDGSC